MAALLTALCCVADAQGAPESSAYTIRRLVEPSAFHGIHGLAFDAQDRLYAGSVNGQSIYRVDRDTGQVETIVPPPEGMADDLVFLADGTMVWTSISAGVVRARKADEPIRVIAKDLPSINSINVRKTDGRLFAAQVFGGDALWELDPFGEKPPRNIAQDIGGFNGFDIGQDGLLYGPSWFNHQVVRIHPDTGEIKVLAEGFGTPAAVNFDSKGRLYVADTARGELVRVDIATGAKHIVARLATSLDNLAIDSTDHIFVSNMADNAIHEIDPQTGAAREVIKGRLSAPRSIATVDAGNHDEIFVADVFAFRKVDGSTGAITDIARAHAANTPITYANAVSANLQHVVLTNSSGLVQRYDRRTHKLLHEWRDLRGAQSALELPDGSILVSGSPRGALVRLSGSNGAQRKTILTDLRGPVSLAIGPSGAVFLSENGSGEISQIDLTHGTKQTIAKGLENPQGLALAIDGSLFVIERERRQLTRIDARTGRSEAIATDLPVGRAGIPGSTASVAVGARGVLYITSDIENSIYRLVPKRRRN